jgi:hypothetical protein
MPMNRVQFQPGLSMPEFLRQFGTEAQCEAALEQARWPEGFLHRNLRFTAFALLLDRRAGYRAERTEHAAVSRLRA